MERVRPGDEPHRERGQRDDDRRPEVGLLEDERDDRHRRSSRNGIVPPQNPPTFVPRLANQWARYTTSASLASSAGWMAGSGPEPQPAGRTADHDVELVDEDEHEQAERDDVARDRDEPQIAIVDAHHRDHREQAEQGPLDLRADGLERVGLGRQVAAHGRRRVDHQDADRGERDDDDEDRVVGRVPLALERLGQVLGRRPVGGPTRLRWRASVRERLRVGGRASETRDRRGEVHRSLRARAATRSATASLKARPRAA